MSINDIPDWKSTGAAMGPWISDDYCEVWDGEEQHVCGCWSQKSGHPEDAPSETDKRNSSAIAQLPEIYDCLREACRQTCLYCKHRPCERDPETKCIVKDKWMRALMLIKGK